MHFHHLGWIALPLTQLGNPILIGGLSLLFTLWLVWASGRRAVRLWLLVAIPTVALMAALKIYFLGCPLQAWALRSPSGHTAFSTLVYGAVAYSAARNTPRLLSVLIMIAVGLLIVGIGLSRYLLLMHSISEVVLGWVLGTLALAIFCWRYAELSQKHFPLLPILILALLLAIPLRLLARPVTFEPVLQRLGDALQFHVALCSGPDN